MWPFKTKTQKIKERARRTLQDIVPTAKGKYVADTSSIITKFIPQLVEKGLNGKIIIPNAVIAELEHLANKGVEAGFIGLEEIANLHKIKKIKISFEGSRPNDSQIRHAKSGEIDSLIIQIADKAKASLITADLVQAKSAEAYGLKIVFLQPNNQKKLFSWHK